MPYTKNILSYKYSSYLDFITFLIRYSGCSLSEIYIFYYLLRRSLRSNGLILKSQL
jgi:hypothetical protein